MKSQHILDETVNVTWEWRTKYEDTCHFWNLGFRKLLKPDHTVSTKWFTFMGNRGGTENQNITWSCQIQFRMMEWSVRKHNSSVCVLQETVKGKLYKMTN